MWQNRKQLQLWLISAALADSSTVLHVTFWTIVLLLHNIYISKIHLYIFYIALIKYFSSLCIYTVYGISKHHILNE